MEYFGHYLDNCVALWNSFLGKLEPFLLFLNSLDTNLKFTIKVSSNESFFFLRLKLTLVIINYKLQCTVNQR